MGNRQDGELLKLRGLQHDRMCHRHNTTALYIESTVRSEAGYLQIGYFTLISMLLASRGTVIILLTGEHYLDCVS